MPNNGWHPRRAQYCQRWHCCMEWPVKCSKKWGPYYEIGFDRPFDIDDECQQDALNKKQLLREITARIPQLTSHKERLARETMLQEAETKRMEEKASLAHKSASQKASTTPTVEKKKIKGKKKVDSKRIKMMSSFFQTILIRRYIESLRFLKKESTWCWIVS